MTNYNNNEGNTNLEHLEFDLVPTVKVGLDSGIFTAEVIELYELPFDRVMHALGAASGPNQMMAMLEIFRLAIVDQTKLESLDVLSFNELAEILGQWAMLSTPPSTAGTGELSATKARKIVKKVSLDVDSEDPEVARMIEAVLDPDTSLEDLMKIAEFVASQDTELPPTPKRGRHVKEEDTSDSDSDEDELF